MAPQITLEGADKVRGEWMQLGKTDQPQLTLRQLDWEPEQWESGMGQWGGRLPCAQLSWIRFLASHMVPTTIAVGTEYRVQWSTEPELNPEFHWVWPKS